MAEQRIYTGLLAPEEVRQIEPLIERLNGLQELSLIVSDDEMARKIHLESESLQHKCDLWWTDIARKYQWKAVASANWEIDPVSRKVWMIL
ncbi:MAG: CXXX repeat peptide modification system protein [Prevotella sp.]|nr:CXXX repeat peptide modification system protein [Prevotella sp.]